MDIKCKLPVLIKKVTCKYGDLLDFEIEKNA